MHSLRHIALIAFDGVQILDVTGPASVFAAANEAAGRASYQIHILSPRGGVVASGSGVRLLTEAIGEADPAAFDTVLVGGGNKAGLSALARDASFADWMARACANARRYGSVCTGAFALAHLGLVRNHRVATHWEGTALLARAYPALTVDPDALYVEDGKVWTSAGITTGIDMCMALVARDLGDAVANAVARMLVVYARRPGYQSQFSPVLGAQAKATHGFAALLDWIGEHLDQPLDVALLADRAGMSRRSFHRKFTDATGETPARFIETLRLDRARALLATVASLKEVAVRTGYATPGQLSKAFLRRFGVSPALFRDMHGQA
ncbi:GlxA family transcriptional regulator [Massilia sp. 9I]|uniref:GlxA family transcriptional regulator n=1 Tax=Massilia sp. 9I TaxID=2653152 RepID=UPI0012F0F7A7|nr:helix-turn-helix domain-containing protein [Massilia sp. 9I]VXB67162.1 AraC family transcriptional regulator [Massilia sp. 9I]